MNSFTHMLTTYIYFLGVCILPFRMEAQESPLDRYIREGLESNLMLQSRTLDYDASLEALREARGLFFPNVSFQASYTLAGGGRTIDFPIGDLFNPVYQTLNGLTGEQQFPTDLQNVNEQFLPDNFHETKIRIIQPLFNTDIYFNRKAKEALSLSEREKRQAYENQLVKEIKTAYYQYLQSLEALDIYRETRLLLKEILRVNQRLVDNDKATYDVISNAQFELSQLSRDESTAQKNHQVAQAYFNFLLNKPLDTDIEVSTVNFRPNGLEKVDILQNQAINQRREIRQLDHAIDASQYNVQRSKRLKLPQVNAVLDVGYQGFDYTFDENQDFWLAQFSLSWNIFNGFQRKAQIRNAQIQQQSLLNQSELLKNQIRLEVEEAYYQLEAARSAVRASQDKEQYATDVFRIIQKKYQEDQASYLELTDARTKLTQAQLETSVDTYQYLIQQAQIAYATGLQ